MQIDICDKLADLIVTVLGTGVGWFIANKMIDYFKICKFSYSVSIDIKGENKGDVKDKIMTFTLLNQSHIDAYDVKITIHFNNLPQKIFERYSIIEKYKEISFKGTFLETNKNDFLEGFKSYDRVEIEYVTQFGYKKKVTLKKPLDIG